MTIKKIAIRACTACATVVFCLTIASAQPAEPGAPLPGMRPAGQGTLRFFGLEVYRARLWVSAGFRPEDYVAHPLALELAYQRDFTTQAIARRSIQEMRRVGPFTAQQASHWEQALQAALPDIKAGDRITGLYRPNQGVVFQMQGRTVGEVADPAFARLFFGIWLSPHTSEPRLREALLAARAPGQP